MKPRIEQPLFSKATRSARLDPMYFQIIRAYDCIWSLLYEPADISRDNLTMNARANLEMLGAVIEEIYGSDAFESDPRQLSFDSNVLDMTGDVAQTNEGDK